MSLLTDEEKLEIDRNYRRFELAHLPFRILGFLLKWAFKIFVVLAVLYVVAICFEKR